MPNYGLTDEQARVSKEKFGDNRLAEREVEGFWDKFKGNLGDPMIKILCVALLINVVFAFLGQTEWYESVGIALAVFIATFVSTFSEHKNENAFQKLQAEASLIKCKIYREGKIVELPIDDIVQGDNVLLQLGDKIPADGIIIDGELKVDQSVLNGESKEATKIAAPADYRDDNAPLDFLHPHKVFRGALVANGSAVMQVTLVGDQSVYGKIAGELQAETDSDTPLKVKLGKLAGDISKFGYIGGIAIAVALLLQLLVMQGHFNDGWQVIFADVLHAVMLAVIIIVMAVPEGLPLMIAIVSALNMGKMLRDNVLVRKIAGIETAGSLNLLFSDKTGTITRGKLETVAFIDGAGKEYARHADLTGELRQLLSLSILHNTGAVMSEEKIVGGNATERALMSFITDRATAVFKVSVANKRPFNSTEKYSAAQIRGDYQMILLKGAPEKLLARCKFYHDETGAQKPLTDVNLITKKIDDLAGRAIRVLALATVDAEWHEDALLKNELTLVGIVGIRDEVRPEAVAAIAEVQRAGVQVVMITGDRHDTAVAIAREAGLLDTPDAVMLTSDELAAKSDEEIKKQLPNLRVIARALPSDKSRLVRLAQELDLVVGMTGDGVNDSPALKKADVGFAMGGGSEVAKEASEIVILDDNFSSIDKAILYGRTIFNSVRKFIVFQLTINVAAVLICFICPLLGRENPLSIVQILWINLVMDTLAAMAFGGEPALKRYLQEKPKQRQESVVSGKMWQAIFTGSLLTFGLSLFFLLSATVKNFFRVGAEETDPYLLTGYFAFFIFTAVFNAFNARTDELNLLDNLGGNRGFLWIMALIVAVQVLLIYFGGGVLKCFGLTAAEWTFVLGLAVLIIPVDLLRKVLTKRT